MFVPLFAAWEGRVWRVRRDKCRIAGNWGRMNCNVILCDHKICSIDMCWNTCFKFTWTMEQVEGKLSMFQIRECQYINWSPLIFIDLSTLCRFNVRNVVRDFPNIHAKGAMYDFFVHQSTILHNKLKPICTSKRMEWNATSNMVMFDSWMSMH